MNTFESLAIREIRIVNQKLVESVYHTTDNKQIVEMILSDMAGGTMTLVDKVNFLGRLGGSVGLEVTAYIRSHDSVQSGSDPIEHELDPAIEG